MSTLTIEQLESCSSNKIMPIVYRELRKLASYYMSKEQCNHTLTPTALVHEAFLRIVHVSPEIPWDSEGHFFSAAATAMRRILVESARRKLRHKHGGGLKNISLSGVLQTVEANGEIPIENILALDEALEELALQHPVHAELVSLRFFAGLDMSHAAKLLGISRSTAHRHWLFAKAWLFRRVGDV